MGAICFKAPPTDITQHLLKNELFESSPIPAGAATIDGSTYDSDHGLEPTSSPPAGDTNSHNHIISKGMKTLDEDKDSGGNMKEFTAEEVAQHNCLETSIWIIIGHYVYDITVFIKARLHPSSIAFIVPYYGKDATEAFDAVFHSRVAVNLLKRYEIGAFKGAVAMCPLKSATEDRMCDSELKAAASSDHKISVTKLFIFPVKGCKGLTVQRADLTSGGFVDDRIYAVVNAATLKVINQLTYARLALINVGFKPGTDNMDEGIQLNDQFVPFVKEKTLKVQWKSCRSKILVYDQGESISKWITKFLNADDSGSDDEFVFVRIHEDNYRESEEFFALPFSPKESQRMSAFQNYCPVLLASEESMTELNRRYKEKKHKDDDEKEITWERLRKNIVISGVPLPHYEDFMKHIVFGDSDAEILWSRRRYFCAVPQVNQNNAVRTSEPIATARRYRNAITLNDRTSLPGDDAVFFGSLYGVKHTGIIEVGQEVRSAHTKLGFDELRTAAGKSWFGLTEKNVGSQFFIDYYTQYEKFKLLHKEKYNHDTIRLRFKMSVKADIVSRKSLKECLKMGDYYLLKYEDDDGNLVIRPYTPIFDDNSDEMSFDLLVKVYPNGRMSSYLNNLDIGDSILCKKDFGKVCYLEIGKLRFGDPRLTMFAPYYLNVNKLNLIAGGSGLTPIYQIISNIHLNKQFDETKISFIYANRGIEDVLLKSKLDEIAQFNENIKIHYVLERADDETSPDIDIGYITMDICKNHLFAPNESENDVATLICGPAPMQNAVKRFLSEIGHDEKYIATF